MKIKVNSKEMDVAPGTTVAGLLEEQGVDPKTVVVELNLDISKREQWASLTLSDGDSVEIIRLVSGG